MRRVRHKAFAAPHFAISVAGSGNAGFFVRPSARTVLLSLAHRILVVALLLSAAPVVFAAPAGLVDGGSAEVASVVDGDTIVLKDGSQVRLVGIQAPKLPLGRPNFPAWPMAEDSKAALERLVNGKSVDMRYGGARRDRHGRHLAQLYTQDGTWVQGALLAGGFARVYSFPDNRAVVGEMLAL